MSSVTDREINLCYTDGKRGREGERERERTEGSPGYAVALPAASPADGSAASLRNISLSRLKMVQETSCLKMNAADFEVRSLTGYQGNILPTPSLCMAAHLRKKRKKIKERPES